MFPDSKFDENFIFCSLNLIGEVGVALKTTFFCEYECNDLSH